jgi:hypothetical protein
MIRALAVELDELMNHQQEPSVLKDAHLYSRKMKPTNAYWPSPAQAHLFLSTTTPYLSSSYHILPLPYLSPSHCLTLILRMRR